ncbi:lymphotoxin-alpha-like [Seriola lalandi dorsalis]|uniref:lymphotoxin-alpha-like n=1 Tax=Seriola lalandi dorsalis TaxID=1841481 RepID=UPI000C6F884D|nr:lymphotoxin-alpha-like [Seriola lalandi dorsalis]XP_056232249.1 lymphotoxin-alpha-like [Seriola aureovittata]
MDDDGYSVGEAGLYLHNTSIQLIRRKETRLLRMVQLLTVVVLLLSSAAVALLVVLGGRGPESLHDQLMKQPDSQSSGISDKQQQLSGLENPSALLTAPFEKNTDGKYLLWESKIGNAHCHGGFNYSSGNLVVPRNGVYRVFLQITYEGERGPECSGEEVLSNIVYWIRDSYGGERPLLSAVDTVSCRMKHWSKSLYTAGSFLLEANSRLRVNSTHPQLIANNEYQVFFGAELLPQ